MGMTDEFASDPIVDETRSNSGAIAYTGPAENEDPPSRRSFARGNITTTVLGNSALPVTIPSPMPPDEGLPRQFPDELASHVSSVGEITDEDVDELEDDDEPQLPALPTPPRRPREARSAADAARDSAYERARSSLTPERQQKLDDLRAEWGEGKDSVIFKIVEALSFSEQFFVGIPQQLRDSVRDVVDQAVLRIAESLSVVDVDGLSAKIADSTTQRIMRGLRTRTAVAAGGATAAALLLFGGACGAALTAGYYRAHYEAKLSAIPHISSTMRTAVGRRMMELVDVNSALPLSLIWRCDARAGLHLVKAQYGGQVCVGAKDATLGWHVQE